MIPRDSADYVVNGKIVKGVAQTIESGILFHLEPIPEGIKTMDYRMIIDGLWTPDPLNPSTVSGSSGVLASRILLPGKPVGTFDRDAPGTFRFNYRAAPGETITVGGSFNDWDPFMYEMREISPGYYTLALPFSPGVFHYIFFHRGEQIPDPANAKRLLTRDGRIVSEAEVFR